MATNIKVAIATGDAVLKYVEDDTTVGSNGTADSNIPSTTRIMAIHAEGTAIKFQVAANEASDIYIGDMGVAIFGVVSVSGPTDGSVLTAMLG